MASPPPLPLPVLQRTHSSRSDVNYTGLLHRPGNLFDLGSLMAMKTPSLIQVCGFGTVNLVVRFTTSLPSHAEDEAHFRADKSGISSLDATESRARNSSPT